MGRPGIIQAERPINSHDVRCVVTLFGVKKNAAYFYQGRAAGWPAQYRRQFAGWLVAEYQREPTFFLRARQAAQERARAQERACPQERGDPSQSQRSQGQMQLADVAPEEYRPALADVTPQASP